MTTHEWTPTANGESVATIQGVRIITDGQGKYRPAAVWPPDWCDDLHTAVDVGRRLLAAFDVIARFKRGEK